MDDRRADLAAAFDQSPIEPEVEETPAAVEPAAIATQEPLPGIGEVKETKAQRARDEEGKFSKAPKEPKAEAPPVEVKPEAEKAPEKAPEAPPKPKTAPPKSLGPLGREHWDKLPAEAQQAFIKRDQDAARAIGESSEARQFQQRFKEEMAPFESVFRANGVDPVQGSKFLVQQYAALTGGSMPQRVQAAIGVLQAAGLTTEEGIQALAQGLSGAQPQGGQQTPPVYRDPRVDEIYSRIQQAEQYRHQTLQQQAAEALADVENEEFFEDVRPLMADLVEVAGRNNLRITPREAYNRAILIDPRVSKVVEQRRMATAGSAVQGSMRAASSVRSSPASAPAGADQRDDIRGALEAAWGSQRR